MQCRFLHSADWQLGKPFASIRDEAKRILVQQERLAAVRHIGELARKMGADFVVVAGDLFDSSHVTKATVSAACAAIGEISLPVLSIPGNHDHGGPGTIWEQEFFLREQQQLAPNLQVLLRPQPVVLNSAIIFPAPLLRRHEVGNPTGWIRQMTNDPSLPHNLPRIVLAHGTIQGFNSLDHDEGPGSSVINWIDLSALPVEEIDYIALGDWHGTKQVGAKAWYSGTPEIDRFPKGGGNDPGNILMVSAARGQEPQIEKVSTGRLAWEKLDFHFADDSSLETFCSELDNLVGLRGDEHLLQLTLEGSLGIATSGRLATTLDSWEARLLHLRLESSVTIAPSEEEVIAMTQRPDDPLIANVAKELVSRARGDTEDAEFARIALRELHAALV